MARVSQKIQNSGVNRCAPLEEAAATRFDDYFEFPSSEKRERIWMARRKAAAGIPSKHEWWTRLAPSP